MADLDKIVDELSSLTLLEAAELTKKLEAKWGVSAAAPVAMSMMPMGAAAPVEEVEEKTEFDVLLKDSGASKINVIKEVRALTNLGLREAKEVVDNLGVLMQGVSKEAAQAAKTKLEAAGAVIEVK